MPAKITLQGGAFHHYRILTPRLKRSDKALCPGQQSEQATVPMPHIIKYHNYLCTSGKPSLIMVLTR